jgi:cellulose synthase/poly-beta-1,6-N-acetylglucosamine synthase-like glycosyltransferase
MNALQIIETIAVIPTLFLLIVVLLQYFILLFIPKKKIHGKFKSSISVLIPAHNEGLYLENTINSVLECGFEGKKEIIVIDDGSTDDTPQIIKRYEKKGLVKSIRTNHVGKSNAINKALKLAKNEIIVTVDGDTIIKKGSLDKLLLPFSDERVAATTAPIKVANTSRFLTWFQRVEYIYFSFYKSLCDRVNAIIWLSGTLSAVRKKLLISEKGYSSKTFAEDIDIALRLIKKGYKIRYVPDAVALTFVPETLKGLAKQRFRWLKGVIQMIKKYFEFYFNRKYIGPGFFSLPMMLYWYWHALVMGLLLFLQIILGYYNYFYIYGNIVSFEVIKYFFYWFSVFGIINLSYQIIIGNFALTLLSILNVIVVCLTYFIYLYSMRQLKEKITVKDVIALIFMFPYWLFILAIQAYSNIEWFRRGSKNWWNK